MLALQDVVGGFGYCAVDLFYLTRAETIMVVLELHRHAGSGIVHGFELSAFFPCVRPLGVIREIADGVVRKFVVAEMSQLVLPVCVRIAVDQILSELGGLCGGGKNVCLLAQDVSAPVVGEEPRSAIVAVRCRVTRIVYARQLSELVILVGNGYAVSGFAGDVAAIVVGVYQRDGSCDILLIVNERTVR